MEGRHDVQQAPGQESPYKGKTGVRRILNAFGYSLAGLREALRLEDAFRQECLLAVVLVPLAVRLAPDRLSMALMIGSVLCVLVVELINSAIEAAVDRTSLERHPLAKRAKDLGSAAVLITFVQVALVWGCVLWPHGS